MFRNAELFKVWMWCLMRANHEKCLVAIRTGRGETVAEVLPGGFIFGRFAAAKALDMKPATVYARMKKLEKLGNVTIKPSTHHSVVTICKWADYQPSKTETEQATEQASSTQVAPNEQASSTEKNYKNTENSKNTAVAAADSLPIDTSDGVNFAGPERPARDEIHPDVMRKARAHVTMLRTEANIGEIVSVDKWLREMARDAGGGHMLMPHLQTFQVCDFEGAWSAYFKKRKKGSPFTGTWITNQRSSRRNEALGSQEKDNKRAMAADKLATDGMDPTAAALSGRVPTLTDEEQRDAWWGSLPNMDRKRRVDAARTELDGHGTHALIEQTARESGWREQKGKPHD